MEELKMMALEKNDDGLRFGLSENSSGLRRIDKEVLIDLVIELDEALKTATSEYDKYRYNELITSILSSLS